MSSRFGSRYARRLIHRSAERKLHVAPTPVTLLWTSARWSSSASNSASDILGASKRAAAQDPLSAPALEETATNSSTEKRTLTPAEAEEHAFKTAKPLWDDCDTPEEIMEEEKYGSEEEPAPEATAEHTMIALKAFLYGTILAIVGVGIVGVMGMAMAGFLFFIQSLTS